MTELERLLDLAGITILEGRPTLGSEKFALSIALADQKAIRFESSEPPLVGAFSPESLGLATFDALARTQAVWGLASRIPFLKAGSSLLKSPLADLLKPSESADRSLLLDGYRFFVSAPEGENARWILVVEARQEFQAKRLAARSQRAASALKRLGKTLTMNQNCEPLCMAAAHELASALELAACLLWVIDSEERVLELRASVGASRRGTTPIRRLNPDNGSGCAAEIAASTRRTFALDHVAEHVLTSELEAKLCYLKPGPMSVHPLEIGGKLLGVLELVGRDGDTNFEDSRELYETIAEHLALAINGSHLYENLERLASHDPLTGLPNHRCMQEFLHTRVHEALRTGHPLGMMLLDVDHFRAFNEEEGHDAGDDVLRLIADSLRACVRPYDLAARYGGEEFVVIMPSADLTSTATIAERLRALVEQRPYVTKSGRQAHVSISIGCSAYPQSSSDASDLLKAADLALYEAKKGGRNRVVGYKGTYHSEPRPPTLTVESLRPWLSQDEWIEGLSRIDRLTADLNALRKSLALSDSQMAIMRALLLMAPTYWGWIEDSADDLERAESAEEFRVLLPSLHSLTERYDGTGARRVEGKRIPLLGRVLQVLLATEKGESLHEDPGLFDPEVVGLVTAVHRAA